MDKSIGDVSGSQGGARVAYAVTEVAAMLGVSADTVRELIRGNSLPHKRLGRRVVIPAEAFARWLNDIDGWQSARVAPHG